MWCGKFEFLIICFQFLFRYACDILFRQAFQLQVRNEILIKMLFKSRQIRRFNINICISHLIHYICKNPVDLIVGHSDCFKLSKKRFPAEYTRYSKG